MKKARYCQDANVSHVLDVLKENADGTVDLGRNGVALVTSCPLSDDLKIGHATPIKEAAKEPAPKK